MFLDEIHFQRYNIKRLPLSLTCHGHIIRQNGRKIILKFGLTYFYTNHADKSNNSFEISEPKVLEEMNRIVTFLVFYCQLFSSSGLQVDIVTVPAPIKAADIILEL